MQLGGNKTTLKRAQQLRREATLPERLLWAALRRKQHGLRFRHQHPAGHFILDFYCPSARLCVEIDGAHHDLKVAHDQQRDRWLREQGIRTVRVSAKDVLDDPDAVAIWIGQTPPPALRATSPSTGGGAKPPTPLPLPRGRCQPARADGGGLSNGLGATTTLS